MKKILTVTSDLLNNLVVQNVEREELQNKKIQVFSEIKNFETYLIGLFPIKVFLHSDSKWHELLNNKHEVYFIQNEQNLKELQVEKNDLLSVLISETHSIEMGHFFDFVITDEEITEFFNKLHIDYKNIDYCLYDRLYLDAKLERKSRY